MVFYEEIEIEYEGMYFSLFSSSIKPENVEEEKFVIFTDSKETAQQYAFEKKEQFASSICESTIIEKDGVSEWLASLK